MRCLRFFASKIELTELVYLLNFLVQGVDSVLEHLIVAIRDFLVSLKECLVDSHGNERGPS